MSRRSRAAFVALAAALVVVGAACVPVTPPPPPPTPQKPSAKVTTTTAPGPQLAAPPPTVAVPTPAPGFTPTDFVTGLSLPWDIAFLPGAAGPDGSMLYTENDAGTVKAYISAGEPGRVLTTIPVNGSGEGGAMGIAVHPSWPTSPYVYVCYTTGTDNRVSRFTLTLDGASQPLSLGSELPIVPGMLRAESHNGCRIRFQPGASPAALFVTMGDAGVGTSPQNSNGLNGKVLRVTDSGAAYPSNASGQHWYTKGHRNPQGIAFRPGSNASYDAEHGPGINDEVNALTNGGNAGWDPIPGYTQSVPMTDLAKFPTAIQPKWRSGDARTIAISGIDFLSNVGPADWKAWNGMLVGAVLKDHELRMFVVDGAGNITGQVQIFDNGTRLRVPVLGPDGALYVPTDVGSGGGKVLRFVPS